MILFHGSEDDNLTTLSPMPDPAGTYVWASPDIRVAIAFARRWTDEDMSINVLEGRVILRERKPGAFKLLKGPGYVYVIPDGTPFEKFVKKGKKIEFEYISSAPVPAARILHLPDVLQACHVLRFEMHPYGEKFGKKHFVRIFVTGNEEEGILLHHYEKANRWGPPAGKVERGENIFVAAARELGERTGWTGAPGCFRLVGSYSDKDGNAWHLLHVNFEDLVWKSGPQTQIRWSDGSDVKTLSGNAIEISGATP